MKRSSEGKKWEYETDCEKRGIGTPHCDDSDDSEKKLKLSKCPSLIWYTKPTVYKGVTR
jgi:hypothetical protein